MRTFWMVGTCILAKTTVHRKEEEGEDPAGTQVAVKRDFIFGDLRGKATKGPRIQIILASYRL